MNNVIDLDNTYNRFNNNATLLLKNRISNLYLSDNIFITNSGLHSNSLSIYILIMKYKKINIIYPDNLYYENYNIIKYFNKHYDINIIEFKLLDDNDNILNIFNDNKDYYNILFIESCSNPFSFIFNFDLIPLIKNISNNNFIICDNTWLSINIFNPLIIDIDIVTISLTKYYSGNEGILGAIILKNNYLNDDINEYLKIIGIHNNPTHINNIINSISFMNTRMKKISFLTKKIINYLNKFNIYIVHPFLLNHISYDIAIKYFDYKIYPSTFLIEINKTIEDINIILKKITIFDISTSFGGNLTKIDKNIFTKNDKNYIRISIGYDDSYSKLIYGFNELIFTM